MMNSEKWIPRLLLAACLVALAGPASAQEQTIEYAKETVLDFEADTIEGDLTRPDGTFVDARQNVQHSNLIEIRQDFRDEVLESVGEL